MNNKQTRSDEANKNEQQPYRMRLPGFIKDEEVGLGDLVKRMTSSFGIQPCGDCEQRAAMLNQWLIFTNKHTK
jgi:hypothetical protein